MAGVYKAILDMVSRGQAGYAVLLDPDRAEARALGERARIAGRHADFIFVGGSICIRHEFDAAVRSIKANCPVPVVIFPGDATQVSESADAILFLSLVSGRNADLLIGEHVKAAPLLKRHALEVIPVAYMLIESGRTTSVQFVSQSLAIPRDKPEIAMAHALAGEYLGMRLAYLEAGSGAARSVPPEMVKAVGDYVSIPVIVGGGIADPEQAAEMVRAGASIVVTGDSIEKNAGEETIERFAHAIHGARSARLGASGPRSRGPGRG